MCSIAMPFVYSFMVYSNSGGERRGGMTVNRIMSTDGHLALNDKKPLSVISRCIQCINAIRKMDVRRGGISLRSPVMSRSVNRTWIHSQRKIIVILLSILFWVMGPCRCGNNVVRILPIEKLSKGYDSHYDKTSQVMPATFWQLIAESSSRLMFILQICDDLKDEHKSQLREVHFVFV